MADTAERTGLARDTEVAEFVRTTRNQLARMRHEGYGPPYVKLGRSVRYRWSDISPVDRGRAGGAVRWLQPEVGMSALARTVADPKFASYVRDLFAKVGCLHAAVDGDASRCACRQELAQ
jgi:hypothetical protein